MKTFTATYLFALSSGSKYPVQVKFDAKDQEAAKEMAGETILNSIQDEISTRSPFSFKSVYGVVFQTGKIEAVWLDCLE